MSYHVVTTYDDDPEGRLRPTDHRVQRDEDGFVEITPPIVREEHERYLAALAEVETLRAERDRYRHEAAAAGKTCAELAERLAQANRPAPECEPAKWSHDAGEAAIIDRAKFGNNRECVMEVWPNDDGDGSCICVSVDGRAIVAAVVRQGRSRARIVAGRIGEAMMFIYGRKFRRAMRKEAANGMA